MAKTNKYVVVEKGCYLKGSEAAEIGTRVVLTEARAAGMVGKIRLLKDYEETSKSQQDLIKENALLTKQVAELTAQLDEATAPKSDEK